MSQQALEGRYTLETLSVNTKPAALDISKIAAQINIFESIFAPTPVMILSLIDAQGLTDIPFTEHSITISFTTHDQSNPVKYTFKVVKEEVIAGIGQKMIVLIGVSEEAVKSKNTIEPLLIKKKEAENIVKAYLDKLESKKPFFAEKTRGLHSYDLTGITPFEAIDMAKIAAMSQEYNGHAFVFFENSRGYHFKSIEKLIDEGVKNVGDKLYIRSQLAKSDPENNSARNILALKVIPMNSSHVSSMVGGFFNKVKFIDTKTMESTLYEIKAKNLTFKSLNTGSFTFSQEQLEKYSSTHGKEDSRLYNPDTENHQFAEKIQQLPYFMAGFLNTILHVTVHGDSTVSVGDVIACKIPKAIVMADDPGADDPVLSGNYLVCKCRHTLSFNENANYVQSFELIKDGVGGESPSVR